MSNDHGVGWGVFVWSVVLIPFWTAIITKLAGVW
jgi:hypothetical protein